MRSLNILGLALAFALSPTLAMADTGWYIDGSVGQASVDDGGIDDSDTSFRIGTGWRFIENFGAEIGYQDLGKVSDSVAGAGASASVETDGLYAGIAGKIPLYDANTGFFLSARTGMYWWDATGRVQVGNTTVSVDDSDSDFYVGVGGGYDFNEQFGLGLTYDRYNVGDNDADFTYGAWSLAGEVRF